MSKIELYSKKKVEASKETYVLGMDGNSNGDSLANSTYYNTSAEYAEVYNDEEKSSTDGEIDGDNESTSNMNALEKSTIYQNDDPVVTIRPNSNDQADEPRSKRKVPSLYDENLYALPNEEEDESKTQTPKITTAKSKEKPTKNGIKKNPCNKKVCWFFVLGVFLLTGGIGGAIYLAIFHKSTETGKYYFNHDRFGKFVQALFYILC